MLGIDDFWVWSAYVLCLLSTVLCVAYGFLNWNRNGTTPAAPEDVQWEQEEEKIDEAL